jgi:hypothetical protein
MNPKHIHPITKEDRTAKAPYNFVELPEKVVEAQSLPDGGRYHPERHTGRIECTLTTKSKLYTRCGWSPENFAKYSEPPTHKQKKKESGGRKKKKASGRRKDEKFLLHSLVPLAVVLLQYLVVAYGECCEL